MKTVVILLSLILSSCASVKKLSPESRILSASPISLKSDDFTFSELILILKINHDSKKIGKCHGIFPNDHEREELIKLYYSKKLNKSLKFERKNMVSFMDKQEEVVIYSMFNDESLEAAVSGCERLIQLYEMEGFEK